MVLLNTIEKLSHALIEFVNVFQQYNYEQLCWDRLEKLMVK
jgi:hypothetical protein